MTLVTTSRRPAAGLRGLARDLAFALKARYLPRGKHGLRNIAAEDPLFFVISQEKGELMLDFFHEDEPAVTRIVTGITPCIREEQIQAGIRTSDTELYGILKDLLDVTVIEDEKQVIIFDGPQRRQMILTIREHVHDT